MGGPHQEEVMEHRDGKGGQLIHQEDVAEVMAVVVEAPVADMVEVAQVLEEVDQEAMVEDLEETVEGLVEEVAVGLFLANNVEQCRSSSVALFPGNSADLFHVNNAGNSASLLHGARSVDDFVSI